MSGGRWLEEEEEDQGEGGDAEAFSTAATWIRRYLLAVIKSGLVRSHEERRYSMLYSGTDPESYITEYTLVYEDYGSNVGSVWGRGGGGGKGGGKAEAFSNAATWTRRYRGTSPIRNSNPP